MIGRWFLPAWFLFLSAPLIVGYALSPEVIGFDARLYLQATRAWLEGSDPWRVTYLQVAFAAPPISLLPLVPFSALPAPWDSLAIEALVIVGTVASMRMLRLPWWWLMFPPVVQGTLSGNVQMLLIPLVLSGGGWLASALKVYAVLPLMILGRWRQLAGFVVLLLLTASFLPWGLYLSEYGFINANLQAQTGYGLPMAFSVAILVPALVAIAVVGRERGAWLAVPALWPSQQWYYASIALPVRSALVGFLIAVPVQGSGAIALFAFALYVIFERRHRRRSEGG